MVLFNIPLINRGTLKSIVLIYLLISYQTLLPDKKLLYTYSAI
jgi:hypothetical protein